MTRPEYGIIVLGTILKSIWENRGKIVLLIVPVLSLISFTFIPKVSIPYFSYFSGTEIFIGAIIFAGSFLADKRLQFAVLSVLVAGISGLSFGREFLPVTIFGALWILSLGKISEKYWTVLFVGMLILSPFTLLAAKVPDEITDFTKYLDKLEIQKGCTLVSVFPEVIRSRFDRNVTNVDEFITRTKEMDECTLFFWDLGCEKEVGGLRWKERCMEMAERFGIYERNGWKFLKIAG